MKKYARVRYDEEKDMYIMELFDNETETWDYSNGYYLRHGVTSDGKSCGLGADFVHFQILKDICRAVDLGWTVSVLGVPMELPND